MTRDQDRADVVVLPVIGRIETTTRLMAEARERRQKVIIWQLCLRSTMRPHTSEWMPLWREADVVMSYYDLAAAAREDGVDGEFTFYHAPLGVDADLFNPDAPDGARPFVVTSHGSSRLTESVRECAMAAQAAGRRSYHLGPKLSLGDHVSIGTNVSDEQVAAAFRLSEFVSGLRRVEGFELPAAEGLVSGARPILFDRPHYRQWYGDFADYIPEEPRENVLQRLTELFKTGARKVSNAERRAAAELFDWSVIFKRFWALV
jgi:glycosyltransferase involved in cell wall biosynthesis